MGVAFSALWIVLAIACVINRMFEAALPAKMCMSAALVKNHFNKWVIHGFNVYTFPTSRAI